MKIVNFQPIVDGYRNKCEFSCGRGNNNEDKIVGFRYGEYRVGVDRVGSPSVCKNVSDEMKLVVQVRNRILSNRKI